MELEPVIGLEIHVQLKTKSKMFCRCSNDAEGVAPNTHICEVCTGQPGTLPVPNEEAVEMILRAGLALGSELPDFTKFDRKHYFYPDLPKGYQISQYEEPFCVGGTVEVEREDGSQFIVEMERLHLEEDAGKLVHEHGRSGVDLNRAGTPLIECVTKPVVKSAADARLFLQELRRTMRYLGVSDADMEKGHLRCDANISMRPVGDNKLYPKTEIKNVNSFKFVEQALEFEIVRQTGLWEKGTPVDVETTRGFDPSTGKTIEQRTKEGAADYRYFPEPDIPPFVIDATRRSALARHLPELPARKRARFVDQFGLSRESAFTIVDDKSTSDFYENVLSEAEEWLRSKAKETKQEHPEDPVMIGEGTKKITKEELVSDLNKKREEIAKLTANWITTEVFALLKKRGESVKDIKASAENFAELLVMLYEREINSSAGQKVLEEMLETGQDPSQIVEEKGLTQVSDEGAIQAIVDQVIAEHEGPVNDYKAGTEQALQFLVGQVMKHSKGAADPQLASELLKKSLS